ncbi:MAG TPA: cytochrome c oxidase subunit 3 [Gammaproteobacteria bacterium]|nr:cytochrome c oxidase subunit 3 [Gammaproteobacteria bacterium]
MSQPTKGGYYLPDPSFWPIIGSIGLFCIMFGAANWLHSVYYGPYIFFLGVAIIIFVIFGWFGTVIRENQHGLYDNKHIDMSFRLGMCWFIFSEVMFFGVFFGALFYSRVLSVPWIGGEGHGVMTHILLWPNFNPTWPVLHNPDPSLFVAPKSVMETWGLPALNTLILLTSGVTITVAHWGILQNRRMQALIAQALTALLGICFLTMQAHEYTIAYLEKGLTLGSGIYGTTFFMLTGFHALHVTIGTIMLIVIFFRIYKHHFDQHSHFAFEAVSWYWHFVDVVWLLLFVFVYWM